MGPRRALFFVSCNSMTFSPKANKVGGIECVCKMAENATEVKWFLIWDWMWFSLDRVGFVCKMMCWGQVVPTWRSSGGEVVGWSKCDKLAWGLWRGMTRRDKNHHNNHYHEWASPWHWLMTTRTIKIDYWIGGRNKMNGFWCDVKMMWLRKGERQSCKNA